MHLSATKFALADPLCPSCGGVTAEGDRACRACGYGFEFASRLIPYPAPALRKFIDFDGHLSRHDIRDGQRALEKLRAHFPQVTLCTCLVNVPDGVSITEFGFWLFNQSIPEGPRLIERRLHSILLLIDPTKGEATLTVGYGLDPFLDDADLQRCLQKIRRPLAAKNYGKALRRLCASLRPVLARGFQFVHRNVRDHIAESRHQQHQPHRHPLPTSRAQPSYHESTQDTPL